ncbi:hypothetical protein N9K67_03880 [Opitutaceae bacterium]|nr:hypothetical protein [Opitutaceae bacterium]
MKTTAQILRAYILTIVGLVLLSTTAFAQKKNPTSKLYIADLEGQSEIDTGERIDDIRKKSVHNAQGTVIETKADSNNAMVFSNGTGVFLDSDTRMEVRRFSQEPFTPNRTDLESEPSISQTYNYVPRGRVGICAPRMVAGSSMVYATPHGSANIRGKKVVVEAMDFETKISAVEGEVTIKSGSAGGAGRTLRDGEQALISQHPGQPPSIIIQPIPDVERADIEDKVTLACNARRTVYFDASQKKSESGNLPDNTPVDGEKTPDEEEGDGDGEDVFIEKEDTGGDVFAEKEDTLTPGGLDDLFLDETAGADDTEDVLVPVVVVPVTPDASEAIISPAEKTEG